MNDNLPFTKVSYWEIDTTPQIKYSTLFNGFVLVSGAKVLIPSRFSEPEKFQPAYDYMIEMYKTVDNYYASCHNTRYSSTIIPFGVRYNFNKSGQIIQIHLLPQLACQYCICQPCVTTFSNEYNMSSNEGALYIVVVNLGYEPLVLDVGTPLAYALVLETSKD